MAQRSARAAFSLLTAFALISACTSSGDEGEGSLVSATLISATLAEDCGGGAGRPAGDAAGACAEDQECPSFCQQTSMQLVFDSTAMDAEVPVEIVGVRLLDAETLRALDDLEARTPTQWQNESYVSWDSMLPAGVELRTSYPLSAPDWNAIGEGGVGFRAYDHRYILEVTIRIDGIEQKVRSEELSREPLVAT